MSGGEGEKVMFYVVSLYACGLGSDSGPAPVDCQTWLICLEAGNKCVRKATRETNARIGFGYGCARASVKSAFGLPIVVDCPRGMKLLGKRKVEGKWKETLLLE